MSILLFTIGATLFVLSFWAANLVPPAALVLDFLAAGIVALALQAARNNGR